LENKSEKVYFSEPLRAEFVIPCGIFSQNYEEVHRTSYTKELLRLTVLFNANTVLKCIKSQDLRSE